MKTAANVVQLRARSPIAIPLGKLDSYDGVRLVARVLREWEREAKENTFKKLASRANLWPTTVRRLASGDTKVPRLHTVLSVLGAVGYTAVRIE
jgi:hypothetical protein